MSFHCTPAKIVHVLKNTFKSGGKQPVYLKVLHLFYLSTRENKWYHCKIASHEVTSVICDGQLIIKPRVRERKLLTIYVCSMRISTLVITLHLLHPTLADSVRCSCVRMSIQPDALTGLPELFCQSHCKHSHKVLRRQKYLTRRLPTGSIPRLTA